jgi:hypothetical protein
MEARLCTYWRIEAPKKIRKRYAKGWRPRQMTWSTSKDGTGSGDDRLLVLWERERKD